VIDEVVRCLMTRHVGDPIDAGLVKTAFTNGGARRFDDAVSKLFDQLVKEGLATGSFSEGYAAAGDWTQDALRPAVTGWVRNKVNNQGAVIIPGAKAS
jgi:hypothetical protein